MRSIICLLGFRCARLFGPLRLILKSLIMPADAAGNPTACCHGPGGVAILGARAAAEGTLQMIPPSARQWNVLRPAQRAFVAEIRGLPPAPTSLLNQIIEAEMLGGAVHPADQAGAAIVGGRTPHRLPQPTASDPGEYLNQFNRRFGWSPCGAQPRARAGCGVRATTGGGHRTTGMAWSGPCRSKTPMRCSHGQRCCATWPIWQESTGDARRSMDGPGHGLSRAQPRGRSRRDFRLRPSPIEQYRMPTAPRTASRDRSGGQDVPRQHRHPAATRSCAGGPVG